MTSILSLVQLTSAQIKAVIATDANVAVTAGAGTGKTRTLVARYLHLLESGLPLRSLVAITFTERAAREMRTRIRQTIQIWLAQSDVSQREVWFETFANLDAARIGTIHSLCAEILRAHPVEASQDPAFDVLDENAAAVLRARAAELALAWAATDPNAARLFGSMTERGLRNALSALLNRRLDAAAAFAASGATPLAIWKSAVAEAIAAYINAPEVRAAIDDLIALQANGDLRRDAGDKLAPLIEDLLSTWAEIQAARMAGDWDAVLPNLYRLRRKGLPSNVGKKGRAKEAVLALRSAYDATLQAWLGGQRSNDTPAHWAMDRQAADLLPELHRLFQRALKEYDLLKADLDALDFDDLESHAADLLTSHATVRTRWQKEVNAVLVDEFQDTNERQRKIVYALSDFPASNDNSLFIVGDAKQSIYRFRGADVTVFRRVQTDVMAAGGRHVHLDLTFRAHERLVAASNALLAPILGSTDDPAHPYQVPFAPLRAQRQLPRQGTALPFVEFHLGIGETADESRRAAADALAARLYEMHHRESIDWGDVALLFRASTAFPTYEDALERAGIPFVTVAGRGFYERPEVRDLLNALAAIADPTDDLALAGLLRSPAFALTDSALYRLRWGDDGLRRSMWATLNADLSILDEQDAQRAAFAQETIARLHRSSGRVPVAQVLKDLLDVTHYRAALRLTPGGDRLRRNVDKLLADAHRSGLVSVAEFLEYIAALRESAAREGEAPIEASGAVQLMTAHKAKGLEFPVIVIADAAHRGWRWTDPVIVEPTWGVALKLQDRENKAQPVYYRLATTRQTAMEEAESKRLLYVAATRAKDKLLVSGHTKRKKDGSLTLDGWLGWLGAPIGLPEARLDALPEAPHPLSLTWPNNEDLTCTLYPPQPAPLSPELAQLAAVMETGTETAAVAPGEFIAPFSADLLESIHISPAQVAAAQDADDKMLQQEQEPPTRVWRVVPRARQRAPAWVLGQLTHVALAHWRFPDQPNFKAFLRPYALETGLADEQEIDTAIANVQRLLLRFQQHPLYTELDDAERYHELPYSVELAEGWHRGIVDLLHRTKDGWRVVEFKTDELRAQDDLSVHIADQKYDQQVARYVEAVGQLLGERPAAVVVFLNVDRQVCVVSLP